MRAHLRQAGQFRFSDGKCSTLILGILDLTDNALEQRLTGGDSRMIDSSILLHQRLFFQRVRSQPQRRRNNEQQK